LVGVGYSVLGLFPHSMSSWYFYTAVDGIAWGILYVLFVILIWGYLSYNAPSDKYYAIGVIPFFISKFLELVLGNTVAGGISDYALFSFVAFFLFLAVLPLVYAPETLPEKVMKDRDLKSYIEKAQKAVQKETKKSYKQLQSDSQNETIESPKENSKENIEAQKLAEKYY